jgi:uncharacterized protein (DUF2141 family)
MSRRFRVIGCIISSLGAVSLTMPTLAQSRDQATIILKVTGFRSERGQVQIAVFNAPEKWPKDPAYSSTIDVNSPTVTWKINDVPFGDYAVAVFHDENRNGKMDKNLLGIPVEAYGFSNNQRVTFGPPKWETVKFSVRSSVQDVSIEVK